MKDWSKNWKSSGNPGKQRKYLAEAPKHLRHRFMRAKLSADLRKKHGINRAALRKGDKVKITRGAFKGKTGSIDRTDRVSSSVYITGIELVKKDGSKVSPPLKPSNLVITELNLNDKRRLSRMKKEKDKEN